MLGTPGQTAVGLGNCPGGSGTKDESAPFTLSGVSGVVIKAGTECYGPITGDTTVTVGSTNCFTVDFTNGTVTVFNHPDHVGSICKGISHIQPAGLPPSPSPSPSPSPWPSPSPSPSPSPTPQACSPGYWKNHTEDWFHLFGAATAKTLLCNLEPQCDGTTPAIRAAAQATIEAAVIAASGSLPCSD
jgi:hypothetical protein